MGPKGIRDEFGLIAKYFAPLAAETPSALGLTDDAAILDVPKGEQLVAAADSVVAGIHFVGNEPPGDIARKVVRVNLSDLAAMGAQPLGLLLAAVFPADTDDDWMTQFAAGLQADTVEFHAPLIGGDTVAGTGPLTLSMTALGAVPAGQALTRGGALVDDGIYVSGTIGDAALGLAVAKGELKGLDRHQATHLLDRYRLPTPRLDLGIRLRGLAHAVIDVSDGLVADLRHICDCSDVGARLEAKSVPVSDAARAAVRIDEDRFSDLLTGGDDYELLFTLPRQHESALLDAAAELGLAVSCIGTITRGNGLEVESDGNLRLNFADGGYRHFS